MISHSIHYRINRGNILISSFSNGTFCVRGSDSSSFLGGSTISVIITVHTNESYLQKNVLDVYSIYVSYSSIYRNAWIRHQSSLLVDHIAKFCIDHENHVEVSNLMHHGEDKYH